MNGIIPILIPATKDGVNLEVPVLAAPEVPANVAVIASIPVFTVALVKSPFAIPSVIFLHSFTIGVALDPLVKLFLALTLKFLIAAAFGLTFDAMPHPLALAPRLCFVIPVVICLAVFEIDPIL